MKMIQQREMIERSCRNDSRLQPDAIISKIKEQQENDEGDEKKYIIDDPDLEVECIGDNEDWMFSTHLNIQDKQKV